MLHHLNITWTFSSNVASFRGCPTSNCNTAGVRTCSKVSSMVYIFFLGCVCLSQNQRGTVVSQKGAHGRCTLRVYQRGGLHSFRCFHTLSYERAPNMVCTHASLIRIPPTLYSLGLLLHRLKDAGLVSRACGLHCK